LGQWEENGSSLKNSLVIEEEECGRLSSRRKYKNALYV
jgi:hypothetical protein